MKTTEIKTMEHNFNNLIDILSKARNESSKWVNAAKEQNLDCKYFDYLEHICNNSDKFITGLSNDRKIKQIVGNMNIINSR